jgi:hypothetical protein
VTREALRGFPKNPKCVRVQAHSLIRILPLARRRSSLEITHALSLSRIRSWLRARETWSIALVFSQADGRPLFLNIKVLDTVTSVTTLLSQRGFALFRSPSPTVATGELRCVKSLRPFGCDACDSSTSLRVPGKHVLNCVESDLVNPRGFFCRAVSVPEPFAAVGTRAKPKTTKQAARLLLRVHPRQASVCWNRDRALPAEITMPGSPSARRCL